MDLVRQLSRLPPLVTVTVFTYPCLPAQQEGLTAKAFCGCTMLSESLWLEPQPQL